MLLLEGDPCPLAAVDGFGGWDNNLGLEKETDNARALTSSSFSLIMYEDRSKKVFASPLLILICALVCVTLSCAPSH